MYIDSGVGNNIRKRHPELQLNEESPHDSERIKELAGVRQRFQEHLSVTSITDGRNKNSSLTLVCRIIIM